MKNFTTRLVALVVALSLFLIPALLLLSNKFGLDGIFYAQPISDFLAAILSVIMVSISLRSLTKNSKNVSKEGN